MLFVLTQKLEEGPNLPRFELAARFIKMEAGQPDEDVLDKGLIDQFGSNFEATTDPLMLAGATFEGRYKLPMCVYDLLEGHCGLAANSRRNIGFQYG